MYFVHWFAGKKWGRVLCTLVPPAKSGVVYFVHSFPDKKWSRVLCTFVHPTKSEAVYFVHWVLYYRYNRAVAGENQKRKATSERSTVYRKMLNRKGTTPARVEYSGACFFL